MSGITNSDLWDEVWAEYDLSRGVVAPVRQRAPARPRASLAKVATKLAGKAKWWAGALLVLGFAGYATVPVLASQQVVDAISADEPNGLAGLINWPAIHAGMAGELAAAAHALPPGRTAGLSGAGLGYLQGMAQQVSTKLATAEGLADLTRRRLRLVSGTQLAPAQLQPEGFTRARMVLAAPDGQEGTVTMTLALVDPLRLRWQVVAVALGD